MKKIILLVFCSAALVAARADAQAFNFTTGAPDGRLGTASRPGGGGVLEIESADDFILSTPTAITSATFTGLVPTGFDLSGIGEVQVEIYRVFPFDSDTVRTPNVTTRMNSPSDVAFDFRNSLSGGGLTFTTAPLSASFTAANSILNGINPKPNQNTMGEGPVTGQEVQFSVNFTNALNLPADHYFFVPQVELTSGDFFWLSTARTAPIFTGDLQAWIRNGNLDPDWSREGTDIVGGNPVPTFNEAFSLTGMVPDSGSTALLLGMAAGVMLYFKRRFCS